jgi:2,4-dienoyl-CoA reductase (NADPH2)
VPGPEHAPDPQTAYPHLFAPIRIAGLTIKNRIAMSAMSTHMVGPNGTLTPRQIAFYRERALGGAGLVTVEYSCVESLHGLARGWQVVLDSPAHVAGHIAMVDAIRSAGARVSLQLHHAGRQSSPDILGGRQPVAPSAVPSPAYGPGAMPRALEDGEIRALIERFAYSASLAMEAGYDAIELHAAHGYLIGQFLSPLTNLRDDEWGGDFERRLRFPMEVIRAVKKVIGPARPLIYRFSAEEFLPGGLTIDDSERAAPHLVAAGADALHVSTGTVDCMERVIEPMSMPDGWRRPYSARIRAAVDVPVLTVGQIRDPATAEQIIADGVADMVALGRALLVDPFWATKALAGRPDDIRPCTACNWCVGPAGKHRGIGCAENPRAGHELDRPLGTFGKGRRATVVGGGPGGMVAALMLAEAEFDTILYEARDTLGGGLIVSGTPPLKDKLLGYLAYLERRIAASRIRVRLGTRIDSAALARDLPDAVIIASGTASLNFALEGVSQPHVLDAFDLLLGDARLPGGTAQAVIYGGGETGCETAEYLAEQGVKVVLVSRSPASKLARGAERLYRSQLRKRLEANPLIEIMENSHIERVGRAAVAVRGVDGVERSVPAGAVILAQGRRSAPLHEEPLEAAGICVATIGDASRIGRIGEAVSDAYRAVRTLADRVGAAPHGY